jgi:ribonucleoside-diphosphate reductase alpha chain
LGSINFAALVREPFEAAAALDEAALEDCARVGVRLLDNAIDVSNFPLPEQEHEARMKRRIGLGFTGLADALIMCGARYGSDRAVGLTERWVSILARAAYLASTELAAEKGPFPLYEPGPYLAGENVQRLDAEVRAAIERHGMRNALVTSVAPTGTISLFADNVSSGLEPVFSFSYSRAVTQPDGGRREEQVSAYSLRLYRQLKGEAAPLSEAFVDAQQLTPEDHVAMQAAVQAHIDSAVSKTINLPEEISFEDFKDIYRLAYASGCKGCTTYRPNEVTGAVLSRADQQPDSDQPELPLSEPTAAKPAPDSLDQSVVYMTRPLDRPEVLEGNTYKVRWPETDHAIYITINDVVQDSRRRPFEVFINSKNTEHYAWTVGLTRMISAVFRRGGDISFVVDELKAVFDPRGGQWVGGRYVPSLLAAIGEVIEEHLIEIGFIRGTEPDIEPESQRQALAVGDEPQDRRFRQCPRCGQASLVRLEGCDTCTACAYSRCG